MIRHWTQEETEFLKNNKHQMTAKEIAQKLNRTIDAVKCKINKCKTTVVRQFKWNEEDVKFLKDNFVNVNYKELAEYFNVRVLDIRNKVFELGLRNNIKWNKQNIDKLKELKSQGLSLLDIAKEFNTGYSSVYSECAKLGLQEKHHNLSNTNIFNKYSKMIERCINPNCRNFHNYGGRGISVCQEWLDDFMNFYNWSIENGYKQGLTIDRIDNDGNYCPENCKWSTNLEQQNNKRNSFRVTAFGETKTTAEWSRDPRCKVNVSCLRQRLHKGWSSEEAITVDKRW